MIRKLLFLLVCSVCLVLPALAGSEEEMVEAARKEGKLTLASNMLAYPNVLIDAFQKKYPFVKIKHRPFEAVVQRDFMVNLFEAEKDEDRADVMLRCQDRDLLEAADNDWFADLSSLPNWKHRPKILEDDKRYVYFLGSPHVIFYDPAKVKEADLPKSLDELTDAKWKGKVALRNPLRGNSGAFLAHYIKATRGNLDWYTKLGTNRAFVGHNGYSTHEAVNSGKYLVGLSRDVEVLGYAHDRNMLKLSKSKLRWRFLETERPFQYQLGLMSKKAPNQAAARLFMNWLLSAEANDLLIKAGYSVGSVQAEHKAHPKVWEWDMKKVERMSTFFSTLSQATRSLRYGGATMDPLNRGKPRKPASEADSGADTY